MRLFIERDPNKRTIKAKYFLAKPNKIVTAPIHEAYGGEVSYVAGGIHELNFSIPYYIEKDMEMVLNPNVEKIKERMLIKRVAGTKTEWFMVDGIGERGDDEEEFSVSAFSLGYEIRDRRLTTFQEESINARDVLEKLLVGTPWNVGTVAPKYLEMYRTFDESGSNALEYVLKIDETYNSMLVFDTETRLVHITDPDETSQYRGLAVDYSRLLENVNVERVSEGLVTRLYIEGSDGLTIGSVNPTGQNYIEDFSYFMYPFEQDANGNIIKSSDFMSDDLCLAILAQQDLIEANAGDIRTLIDSRQNKTVEFIDEETALAQLIGELDTIEAQLDIAKATGDTALITNLSQQRTAKNTQVNAQRTVVTQVQNQLLAIEAQLDDLYADINTESNFTPELAEELGFYILEREWTDDRYIDAEELYQAGLEKFKEYRTPQFTLSVGLVNFLEIAEEEYYWDKLNLNDKIKVKHPRMNMHYFSRIGGIKVSDDSISLDITNTARVSDGLSKLGQAIRQSATSSTILQNSKKKWDKAGEEVNLVQQMMNEEYDANKKRILAGVNNLIEIGKRGIIVRSPDFPNEVIIIQSGIMALSDDDGLTWDAAITPRGIIADRLMGRILAGQELIITNSSGSFTMDDNGAVFNVGSFVVRSSTGNLNLVDRWQDSSDFLNDYTNDNVITPFEKRMLALKWQEIDKRYEANQVRMTHHFDEEGMLQSFILTYEARYQDLYDYLFVDLSGAYPILADENMGNSTPVSAAVFKQKFSEYDDALVELEKQFDFNLQEKITNVEFVITDEEIVSAVTRSETWTFQMNAIQEGINDAKQTAVNANQSITSMMSDLTVSPIEKTTLSIIWGEIKSQYGQMVALASTIGVSSASFTTAYNNLNGVAPKIETDILADMNANFTFTAATRDLFKAKLDAYFLEVEKLNKALSEKVNSTAIDAKVGLDNLMSDLKITPLEKNELARTWEKIKADYIQMNAQGISVNASLTARTNFTNAYNALNGVSPKLQDDILASRSTTYTLTASSRDAFRLKIANYYTAAAEMTKAISDGLKKYVDEIEFGDTNLVPNSSGNIDSEGEEPTYWLAFQSANGLNVHVEEEGASSVKANVTAAGGGLKTPLTPIAGGSTYTLTLEATADKQATFAHQLVFVNSAGVETTPVAIQTSPITAGGLWHKFELTFTAPSDAVSVYTTPRIASSATFPVEIEVRKVQIESGTKSSEWSPSNEDIIRQFIMIRTKISSIEEIVSADSIITTITTSETYKNLMDSKADADAIGDLATKGELGDLADIVNGNISTAIGGIDFSPYVTQLQLEETSRNITMKFSATGGMNLLKNSVGYAEFDFWTAVGIDYIKSINEDGLDTLGFGSGWDFTATTETAYIEQDVSVVLGAPYTLSWYINKTTAGGDVWVEILESGVVKMSVPLGAGVITSGYENYFLTYRPTDSKVTVRIRSTGDAVVTGLMFTIGDMPLQWSLATGEVYNTNLRFNINGIRVSQLDINGKEVGYTKISYNEFAGYYDVLGNGKFEKIFYLNGEETVSKKLRAIEEITMGGIRIINFESSTNKGWAFIQLIE